MVEEQFKELKTLEYLRTYTVKNQIFDPDESPLNQASSNYYEEEETVSVERLKQEAIKWIKLMKEPKITEDEFYELGLNEFWNEHTQIEDTINWIKLFFNITKEELK